MRTRADVGITPGARACRHLIAACVGPKDARGACRRHRARSLALVAAGRSAAAAEAFAVAELLAVPPATALLGALLSRALLGGRTLAAQPLTRACLHPPKLFAVASFFRSHGVFPFVIETGSRGPEALPGLKISLSRGFVRQRLRHRRGRTGGFRMQHRAKSAKFTVYPSLQSSSKALRWTASAYSSRSTWEPPACSHAQRATD